MVKTRRKRGGPPFVMLDRKMLQASPDWEALSHSEMLVYIYLKSYYNGINNGHIPLRYSWLKRKFSSATLSKALKGLDSKGWIKKEKLGGMFRFSNEYSLTGKFDPNVIQPQL